MHTCGFVSTFGTGFGGVKRAANHDEVCMRMMIRSPLYVQACVLPVVGVGPIASLTFKAAVDAIRRVNDLTLLARIL
jgi:hypothetical protein